MPESFPALRRLQNTEFTLKEVNVRQLDGPTSLVSGEGFHVATIAAAVTEHGNASATWEIARLDIEDATGNRIQNNYSLHSWPPNTFRWPATRGENVLKLRAEFVRTSGFGSKEVFVLRDVPVSDGGFATNLPAGYLELQRGEEHMHVVAPSRSPFEMSPYGGGAIIRGSSRRFVLVSVKTEWGEEIGRAVNSWHWSFPKGFKSPPTSVKTVDITVAAPSVEWLEWIVSACGTVTNAASPARR